MKEFDKELLGMGNLFKQSYAALAANLSKTVAVITAIVAVLVTFTDVAFASLVTKEITTALAVILMSAYIIYFSLEDAGERQGEESEEYIEALTEHSLLCEKITPEMIPALRDFTERYALAEAEHRRRNELLRLGYSQKEYEAYLSGEKRDRTTTRALRRIKRIAPIPITTGTLLTQEHIKRKSELCDPERSKHLKMGVKLIPTTLCTIMTVSVVLSTKSNLGAQEICEGIMKLSTLPMVGIRGYLAGLSHSSKAKPVWLKTRARLLKTFLKEYHED